LEKNQFKYTSILESALKRQGSINESEKSKNDQF